MLGLSIYIHRVRLDFFLFSSIKIYVKAENTSDDRKQRRACKASIVPSSFLSMTNNRKKKNKNKNKKKGGSERRGELMISLQMFPQMATLMFSFAV